MAVNFGRIREIAYLEGGLSAIKLIQSSAYNPGEMIDALHAAMDVLSQGLPPNISTVMIDGVCFGTDRAETMDLSEVEAHLQDLKDRMGL